MVIHKKCYWCGNIGHKSDMHEEIAFPLGNHGYKLLYFHQKCWKAWLKDDKKKGNKKCIKIVK